MCPVLGWHISRQVIILVSCPNLRLLEFRQVGQYSSLRPRQQPCGHLDDFYFRFLPHSLILLQLHIALLASSAFSPNLFMATFLSLPPYPKAFSSVDVDRAGKPLQPTSTAHTLTLHPCCLPSSTIGVYFALFNSPDISMRSSVGTEFDHD